MRVSIPPKFAIIGSAILLAGSGGVSHAQQRVNQSSDFADALFKAAPTPSGFFQVGIQEEYFTSNFFYSEFDEFDDEFEFLADDFDLWTTNVSLRYGLTRTLEAALTIPFVNASWTAAGDDDLSRTRSRSDFGIGDITAELGYGYESDDQTFYAFLTGGIDLPTNSLDDFFGGATTSPFVNLEIEKYYRNFGVVLGAEARHNDAQEFFGVPSEDGWSYEYRGGLAYLFTDELYSQVVYVGAPTENSARVEAFVEYLISDRSSIEVFGSQDVSGEEDATVAGVGMNFFFGE